MWTSVSLKRLCVYYVCLHHPAYRASSSSPPQEEEDPSPSVKQQTGATQITILQEIMQIIMRMRMHIRIYHIMHVATYKEINSEIVHLCL